MTHQPNLFEPSEVEKAESLLVEAGIAMMEAADHGGLKAYDLACQAVCTAAYAVRLARAREDSGG